MNQPQPVPGSICKCPECGGKLWWQFTSDEDDGLFIECEDDEELSEGMTHRYWQEEWANATNKVRDWVTSRL